MSRLPKIATIHKSPSDSDIGMLLLGHKMGAPEIERAQELLKKDPEFRQARLMLMGAAEASAVLRTEQVCWFAEHEPRTFLGVHATMAARGNFDEAKWRWIAVAQAHHDDPEVVSNAAWFVLYSDPDRGAELLEDRARSETDPEWALQAALYLAKASDVHKERRASLATRALNAGFLMFRLDQAIDNRRIQLLSLMRQCARRAAMQSAIRALEFAEQVRKARERSDGLVHAQLTEVLRGSIALSAGDTERAAEHLRQANAVEAMPTDSLVSFAAELLPIGANDTVLREVEVLERRFLDCADHAAKWAAAIRRGEPSTRPHFPPKKVSP